MKKIGSLSFKDTNNIVIYYDDKAEHNPYRIYEIYYRWTEYGYRKSKKMLEKYADLHSCTEWLNRYAWVHNEERR